MDAETEKLLLLKKRCGLPAVLLAAAECAPLSKTGGLADVAGALPKSLNDLGFDARVITPFHRCAKEKFGARAEHITDFEISLGWRRQYVGLERLCLDGLVIYLIDNEFYFGDKIYRGGEAEGEQYAFFQIAVLECLPFLDFTPEILHCNDWHTALLPFLIKTRYAGAPQGRLKTVCTIHNIAFQGKFGFDFVSDLLDIDRRWFTPYAIEHYGCVNFLKAGCVFADRVSTVSPSYAEEILTPRFGEGLEEVLRWRKGDLSGIINGIDTKAFDPETDPELEFHYNASNLTGKAENKAALTELLGLCCPPETPIIAMVTRIAAQKGFDLVLEALDALMREDACFVLLGTGEERYEQAVTDAQRRYPGRVCACLQYSESLARRIYAGADFLLMPSAFEPCGLSQMIAMRYGTLPIVHETGGLKDTVVPYNRFTGGGNGFSFADFTSGVMLDTIRLALEVYRDRDALARLVRAAMTTDFSFAPSAALYGRLFVSILDCAESGARHDPFDGDFRRPTGAVQCGQTVRLRINAGGKTESAELIVGDGAYKMERDHDFFSVDFTAPDSPAVLWYYFRLAGDVLLGADGVACGGVKPFQMTVYDGGFETPDWAKGAVMYQIFPDRYRRKGASPVSGAALHRKAGRKIDLHKAWDESVKWEAEEDGGFYTPNDFFGGTFSGIEEELPRLRAAGVDCIYLNPVFEADSNHRYNTGDYMKPDPILGTVSAFRRLCEKAKALGIRIIIDGVFSHTGDDSVYFNKYSRYPGAGAYQGEASPCYGWYDFRSFPDDYRCWWGFKSLPEVDEANEDWQDFVITGEKSIIKTWLDRGAGGYRLDVADELPDGTLEKMRGTIKKSDPDALIIGEVWEDATTKISYGEKRRYALGRALDSVMNYPLRGAVLDFALGRADAGALRDFLLAQKMNYPPPMYGCLMNLLGTHDTARLRTVLGCGHEGKALSRREQAEFSLTDAENALGRKRQRICAAIVFSLPGMPCVYYGDEEGMQGFGDPFCRAPFARLDGEMRRWYAHLAGLRGKSSAIKTGDCAFAAPDGDTLCLLRFDGREAYLVCVSRGETEKLLRLAAGDFSGCERAAIEALTALPEIRLEPMGVSITRL